MPPAEPEDAAFGMPGSHCFGVIRDFPKIRGTVFGVLIIRSLLVRVLYIRVLYFRKPLFRADWTLGVRV